MSAQPRIDARAAVEELRAIRSTDPCAAIAMTTIKAAIHTLETHWLPAATSRDDSGTTPGRPRSDEP